MRKWGSVITSELDIDAAAEFLAQRGILSKEEWIRRAYHEAGHGVVAYALGLAVGELMVSDTFLGSFCLLGSPDEIDYSRSPDPLTRRGRAVVDGQLCAVLAGRTAEELLMGDWSPDGCLRDIERAQQLAVLLGMAYSSDLERTQVARATSILEKWRPALNLLARRSLGSHVLSPENVRSTITRGHARGLSRSFTGARQQASYSSAEGRPMGWSMFDCSITYSMRSESVAGRSGSSLTGLTRSSD